MSLQNLAQNLAAQGRGNDKMLVHMTPREVGGLQALAMAHGGSLTINPETGLPEAGFLESLLPTIVGAGLSMIPGVGPLMAAGIVGGGTALATGDLGKGLMAGLGAYGGAGLGGALTSAGAGTTATAGLEQVAGPVDAVAPTTFKGNLAAAGQGIKNLGTTQGWSDLATGLGQQFPSSFEKSAAVMGGVNALSPTPKPLGMPKEEKTKYEGPYTPPQRDVVFPGADRSPTDSSEFLFFRPTNPVPGYVSAPQREEENNRLMAGYTPYTLNIASGGPIYSPDADMNYDEGFAIGGLTALAAGGGSGRFLQGPGDGTSDSIPAVIGGRQPARLADGEFVIDARTVSELGNGSSKAGAKKLYAMMDRVHAARKKAGRGKDSNAEKFMPA